MQTATDKKTTQWELTSHVNGRPQTRRQIGWFIVDEPQEFAQSGEYAADYWTAKVEPGRYPVWALRDCGKPWHTLSIAMPAVTVSGSWWNKRQAGEPTEVYLSPYAHSVAKRIISGDVRPIELLPNVEARRLPFEYQGKQLETFGLFIDGERC